MAIVVNGKEHAWRPGMTVGDLIAEESPGDAPVVVRIGRKTLTRKEFDSHEIPDESEVLFIHMVAGG